MYNSKVCFKCGESQSLSEFYKHSRMADGHLNKCKSCAKKDTKDNILKNYDYYVEYNKSRAKLPHRKKAMKLYSQTEEGKASARKSKEKWAELNVIKRSASIIVGKYVRDGKLIKGTACEDCKVTSNRLHGHHDDYAYPLIVRWLCSQCHVNWHKLNGSGMNGIPF